MSQKSTMFLAVCAAIAVDNVAIAKDVVITSAPAGAEVSVDGRVLGKTPLTTNRKEIMPDWLSDGAITRATISLRLPMYTPFSVTVSEWSIPKAIDATLEQDSDALQFENYLESIEGLADRTVRADKPAALYVSDDLDSDSFRLEQEGYVLVGYVGASASIVPTEMIREKSDAVGGAVILVKSSDAGIQTELRAVKSTVSGGVGTTFGNSSTFGSATGHAHGSAGYASASATGMASTTASTVSFTPARSATTWVPYSTRQYSTQATLWRKRKANEAGLALDTLPASLRSELQRNSGAYVSAVEEGSRAFLSDVLVGDVIVEAGGRPVRQPADLDNALDETTSSAPVSIVVLRKGARTELELVSD